MYLLLKWMQSFVYDCMIIHLYRMHWWYRSLASLTISTVYYSTEDISRTTAANYTHSRCRFVSHCNANLSKLNLKRYFCIIKLLISKEVKHYFFTFCIVRTFFLSLLLFFPFFFFIHLLYLCDQSMRIVILHVTTRWWHPHNVYTMYSFPPFDQFDQPLSGLTSFTCFVLSSFENEIWHNCF